MLVLSRQKEQTIMIGDLVEITVVDIRGDKVRLGITAPLSIPVHRKEVYEAIQNENRAAARVALTDTALLDQIVRPRPSGPDGQAAAPLKAGAGAPEAPVRLDGLPGVETADADGQRGRTTPTNH
jgi:carbon storage regulator